MKDSAMFVFEVGKTYLTQGGDSVTVLGRRGDCLKCSDGKYRYDREGQNFGAGRVTGTSHDYSCPDNFDRAAAGLPSFAEEKIARDESRKKDPECLRFDRDLRGALQAAVEDKTLLQVIEKPRTRTEK